MRVTVLLGSVALSAGLLLTGCTADVPRVGGSAAPVTAAPVTAMPAGQGTSPSRRAGPAFGPRGYGALKLGMTDKQASATGLITAWRTDGAPACSWANFKGVPGPYGHVTWSPRMGVVAIAAYGDMRTPEGIRIGSSRPAMRDAYPDWELIYEPGQGEDGRGIAGVPGNDAADYRIVTADGKVSELTIQVKNQDCYE